jgi:hypothetical protein
VCANFRHYQLASFSPAHDIKSSYKLSGGGIKWTDKELSVRLIAAAAAVRLAQTAWKSETPSNTLEHFNEIRIVWRRRRRRRQSLLLQYSASGGVRAKFFVGHSDNPILCEESYISLSAPFQHVSSMYLLLLCSLPRARSSILRTRLRTARGKKYKLFGRPKTEAITIFRRGFYDTMKKSLLSIFLSFFLYFFPPGVGNMRTDRGRTDVSERGNLSRAFKRKEEKRRVRP